MVQITHARIDGTDRLLAARDYDPKEHGNITLCCPDKNCPATLTRHAEHYRKHYHVETGEPMRIKIPDYYQRTGGAPQHSLDCTAVEHYQSYKSYAQLHGGLSLGHGAYVFNLNIPTNNKPAPDRRATSVLAEGFTTLASKGARATLSEKRVFSKGLNSTMHLSRMLEETDFEPAYRESILLSIGRKQYTLAEIFKDDPVQFFRDRHADARANTQSPPAAVLFKPIAIPVKNDEKGIAHTYHHASHMTIQGEAMGIVGADGQKYYVSILLHCGSKEIYQDVRDNIKSGARSFLIYTENSGVDLQEFAKKKKEIAEKTAKDSAVFVHIHADRIEQLHVWNYSNGEPRLNVDMGVQRRPPKEIPPELIV